MGVPAVQMALDLLVEEMAHGPVTKSRRPVGFNKPYALVETTPLNVGTQRMLHAMWFIAAHAPDLQQFDIDYTYFKWLANFSTRDHKWVQNLITEAQSGAMLLKDPKNPKADSDGFLRIPLLGPAGVVNGRIYFEFNTAIRRILASPERFAFFSLSINHNLKGPNPTTLHKRLIHDLFRGHTSWVDIPTFLGWFGKADEPLFQKEGFRAVKRYILTPSVAEINKKADFTVEFETKSAGRKVVALRFIMTRKADRRTLEAVSESRSKIFEVLRHEFGLNAADFDSISANSEEWTEQRLNEVIEVTRFRIEHGKTEVASPRGLFMHLLKTDAVLTPVERARLQRTKAAEHKKAETAAGKQASIKEVLNETERQITRFLALSDDEQQALLASFRESNLFGAARYAAKRAKIAEVTDELLVEHPRLQAIFAVHLGRELDSAASPEPAPD